LHSIEAAMDYVPEQHPESGLRKALKLGCPRQAALAKPKYACQL